MRCNRHLKECVPRNSRGAANSSGTVREVPALWVAPGSKAAWEWRGRLRVGIASRLLSAGPVREERWVPKPSHLQFLGSVSAPSGRLPNWRKCGSGCPMDLTAPGKSELKKQSERLGEGTGATRAEPSTQIAPSLGAACEPRRPARATRVAAPRSRRQAQGTHKARTVPLPQRRGPKKSQAEGSPCPRPHRSRCSPSRDLGLEAAC